jgi:O-acetylserine/cysteine efflux transporter
MPLTHLALALAIVAVWGTNFVVIAWGIDSATGFAPLLFATLRFALAFAPAAFFIKRPAVPWRWLAAFGVLLGVGQFGCLYLAIKSDITPGLASLVVQTQVFFTIGLSMWVARERMVAHQAVGLLLAVAGIAVVAAHVDKTVTVLGLGLVLFAAFSWACANVVSKLSSQRFGAQDMLGFVVWSSAFAVPPLLLLSLVFEGAAAIRASFAHASAIAWGAVVWQAAGNMLFGYAAWNWLLARHSAATVTPLALLVPVFGMGASAVMLNESLPGWKLLAAVLVLLGLGVSTLWPRWRD